MLKLGPAMARDSLMIDAPFGRRSWFKIDCPRSGYLFMNSIERMKELVIPHMRESDVRATLLLCLSAVLWF